MPEPDPVKVLFVSSHAQLGGGEAYLRSIVEGLGDGWSAGVVTLHDGPFVGRLREGGHDVTVIPSRGRASVLTDALRLRRSIRATAPDVIHANGIKAALAAVLATPLGGPPVLWLKYDFGWDGALATFVALRCRMVVGISAAVNETFSARAARRARVVFAGIRDYEVDDAVGAALLREELDGEDARPVVALSGRLCPGKGQTDLIDAAPAILAANPGARILLLGVEDSFYPGYRDELRARAVAAGVGDAVRFSKLKGHSPGEAVAVVSACDVLVQPSRLQERGGWKEGFGLAVVEAMHVGTPVVAYANGALPEVVADAGLVVPEGAHAALGDAVNRVLGDPGLRAELTAAGRRRSRERFLMDRVVREMAACYRELASPTRGKA
ncbi:glycosyltransferase [Paraconexibacter sp. AEG42_29]|uniref:Glycosyltransferase n=1 Tax=Paraconexibacter sp. AEG42_29 TaxID=2997339 RepID=A0AAU7AWX3_9ACTN